MDRTESPIEGSYLLVRFTGKGSAAFSIEQSPDLIPTQYLAVSSFLEMVGKDMLLAVRRQKEYELYEKQNDVNKIQIPGKDDLKNFT